MAATDFGLNSPEAVKLWRKRLAREALKATWFQKFTGESDDSLCQIVTDTQKSAGDKVTITLRMQLTGDGVLGDNTLEGNEEALTTYTDSIVLNQLRHAVRSKGKMSEQRIPWKHREEAMSGLRDWWAARLDTVFMNQLAGYTPQADVRYTGNQAAIAPDAGHLLFAGGAASEAAIDNTKKLTLSDIDAAVTAAKLANPMVRPLKVNGEDKYVMFVHTYQATQLRTNTDSGQWLDIQKAALSGGLASKSPIYTGALGEYNGVILHESTRVPHGVNASTGASIATVRRAILCGAQAANIGFGQGYSFNQFDWNEELFDYKNSLGVEAGAIFGLKKSRYNSKDFGTIVVASYSNANDA